MLLFVVRIVQSYLFVVFAFMALSGLVVSAFNQCPLLQQACSFGHDHVTGLQSLLYNVFFSVVNRKDGYGSGCRFAVCHAIDKDFVLYFVGSLLRYDKHIVHLVRKDHRSASSVAQHPFGVGKGGPQADASRSGIDCAAHCIYFPFVRIHQSVAQP